MKLESPGYGLWISTSSRLAAPAGADSTDSSDSARSCAERNRSSRPLARHRCTIPLERRRHPTAQAHELRRCLLQDCRQRPDRRLPTEGVLPRQKLVRHHPEREDVRPMVRRQARSPAPATCTPPSPEPAPRPSATTPSPPRSRSPAAPAASPARSPGASPVRPSSRTGSPASRPGARSPSRAPPPGRAPPATAKKRTCRCVGARCATSSRSVSPSRSSVTTCSAKCRSKWKARAISCRRMHAKLTQSTRLSPRRRAVSRPATPSACSSASTQTVVSRARPRPGSRPPRPGRTGAGGEPGSPRARSSW